MKIFLCTSFSHKVNYDTGEVFPDFKAEIQTILQTIRDTGNDVFAAIEYEGWRLSTVVTPGQAAEFDIAKIEDADVLLAILHDSPSAGLQWEMGYANALGKQVYVISEDRTDIGYWNKALEELGRIKRLPYSLDDMQTFRRAIERL